MIETFTKHDFETFLGTLDNNNTIPYQPLGLMDGEESYLLPLDNQTAIQIRSSVQGNGYSADSGQDSIRAWLVDNDNKPLGSKVSKWTTRKVGWRKRLLTVLHKLTTWRMQAGDCAECGNPLGIYKVKKAGANHGRVFAKCKMHNNFRWLDTGDNNAYFGKRSQNDTMEEAEQRMDSNASGISELENLLRETSRNAIPEDELSASNEQSNGNVSAVHGRIELNEQQKQAVYMPVDANLRVLAGPGSGKCVIGDTLVLTDNGFIRIEDATDIDFKILDANFSLIHPSHFYDLGEQKTIKLTTKSGYEIEGTYEHPVLVLEDDDMVWKQLQNITKDDNILLAWNTELFTRKKDAINIETAYILGQLVADGIVNHNKYRKGDYTITLARTGDLAIPFINWANQYGNVKTYTKVGTDNTSHVLNSKRAIARLTDLGFPINKTARYKYIPEMILRSGQDVQIAFLQGYFDLESYCGERNIEVVTASEQLSKELQIMLLNFGVRASRQPKQVEGYDWTYWRLTISGDALKTFVDQIGYLLATDKFSASLKATSYDSNTNMDTFPLSRKFFERVREGFKELCIWNGKKQYAALNNGNKLNLTHYLKQERQISRKKLTIIADTLRSSYAKELASWLSGKFLVDKVDTIQSDNCAKVYDFTIPVTHSFVANGFINHNTSGVIAPRYVHLVESGIEPERIVCVAFNVTMAAELIEKITKALPNLSEVAISQICTINAFCYRELIEYWKQNRMKRLAIYDWKNPYMRNATNPEWMIKDIIDEVYQGWDRKPSADEVLGWIDTSKHTGLSLEDSRGWFSNALHEHGGYVYEIRKKYDAAMARQGTMDFSDQLYLVERLLIEKVGFRMRLQQKYLHVLVDEAQDVSEVALRILLTISQDAGWNKIYQEMS